VSDRLTVVLPVFDEAGHVAATVGALADAAEESPFAVDLVVVDDGSTDGSGEAAAAAAAGRLQCRVLSQPNRGRFRARLAGLEAAEAELVLLLDARVRLHEGALAFAAERVAAGERVWNGHVDVDAAGNPYGAFGNVLVALAWRDYFREPRTTSYGLEDFDRYPKGTTCFLAPRELLLEAFATFSTRYDDLRHANDDTPVLRALAARERIHLSPSFGCTYTPRGSLPSFVRHSLHRGVVFLDGHGRRESRFFPAVAAFYPVSAALAGAALRRPGLVPVGALGVAAAAGVLAAAAGRPRFEAVSFGALAPVYAVAHGAGMWQGAALALRRRLGARRA
jgi:glycosyltransferase involved in cell wall biosynthesis